ncbi:TRIC cation channel family protein [Actinoallomurus sp. NBC_01490]|uniref:trimeric intracellular cation channel family protein n=1 Tax=Actinoallomurus sp. NBC_01490 TaxID=2903557 RepID=UPI002E2FA719|nr:TRIC cation channel family protein [Actinoallomurus sp. NBC_01490]
MATGDLWQTVQYFMDWIGIFAFALSGALLAVSKDFNIFGAALLAEAAGLGGGLFRDLVIRTTPVAFTDVGYYLAPLVAAFIVFFTARAHRGELLFRAYDLLDAAALALFSVTGTTKALSFGLNLFAATTLGVGSAVGGGILANVIANEPPPALRWNRDLYVLPALVGAGTVALLSAIGELNAVTAGAAAIVAFAVRLMALRYRWHTLRAYVWRNPFAGMRQVPTPQGPIPAPGAWPAHAEHATFRFRSPVPSARPRFPEPRPTHGAPPEVPFPAPPPPARAQVPGLHETPYGWPGVQFDAATDTAPRTGGVFSATRAQHRDPETF